MVHESRQVSVNGVVLAYDVRASGGDQPPLVFVHGYSMRSTAGLYDELLRRLAQRHVVYALDLRGHGLSAGALSGGWSREQLADDLLGFVGALGLDAPVYVGHSFGAELGLFTAIRHPGVFSRLCLLAPGPADQRRDPVEALQSLVEHGRDRNVLREVYGHMFVRDPAHVLELAVDAGASIDPAVHRAQAEQSAVYSIDDRLAEVAAPVLLVVGARDGVVSPERQRDMARKLQSGTEIVLADEGHMVPMERPETVAREILGFVGHAGDAMPAR